MIYFSMGMLLPEVKFANRNVKNVYRLYVIWSKNLTKCYISNILLFVGKDFKVAWILCPYILFLLLALYYKFMLHLNRNFFPILHYLLQIYYCLRTYSIYQPILTLRSTINYLEFPSRVVKTLWRY